jgi:adenylate cyclase
VAKSPNLRTRRRRILFVSGVAAVIAAAMMAAFPPMFGARMDQTAYDILLRNAHTRPAAGRVVIIDIDERSLSSIGQWPWRRDLIGRLIATVRNMGAAVVALDMVFAEPDRYGDPGGVDPPGAEGGAHAFDEALAVTLREGRVVLGYAMRFDTGAREASGCLLHPVAPAVLRVGDDTGETPYFHATGAVCNLTVLAESAGASGFMNAAPDADGILRRVPLLIDLDGRTYPSLALASMMAATGSRDLTLRISNVNSASLRIGDQDVPVDGRANALLRYRGEKNTFPYLSAADVMSGRVEDGTLRDKIVFIGTTALGTREVVATPLDTLFAGVEVQATVADNLLQRDFIRRSELGTVLEGLAVFTVGLAVTWFFARAGTMPGVIGGGIAITGVWLLAGWALSTAGVFVSPVVPTIAVMAVLAVMTLANFAIERRRAETAGRERTNAQRLMVQTLLSLTETRDAETGRHSRRTQQYARLLAGQLSGHPAFEHDLTPERVELISSLAPLHDIGKVGVPDHILNKPGALTPDELAEMRRHPEYGYDVILKAESRVGVRDDAILAVAKDIVYTHHEKWDGTGYPRKLRGSEIPIEGRVMAVVDVYDATTTRTLYRSPMSHDDAVAFIIERGGTHFDPAVVQAFVDVAARFKIVSAENLA